MKYKKKKNPWPEFDGFPSFVSTRIDFDPSEREEVRRKLESLGIPIVEGHEGDDCPICEMEKRRGSRPESMH